MTTGSRRLSDYAVGDDLPTMEFGPITRHTLALYCGGSGDHNPIHVDIDFARNAGASDVFAHGMLSMGLLGRFLTELTPQINLREFGVRFTAITPVNAIVTCGGKVMESIEVQGERQLRLRLTTRLADGTLTQTGMAAVAVGAERILDSTIAAR